MAALAWPATIAGHDIPCMDQWCSVSFHWLISLQVHESQIIGELGKGYKYAIEVLNIGRIGIGAQVIGA